MHRTLSRSSDSRWVDQNKETPSRSPAWIETDISGELYHSDDSASKKLKRSATGGIRRSTRELRSNTKDLGAARETLEQTLERQQSRVGSGDFVFHASYSFDSYTHAEFHERGGCDAFFSSFVLKENHPYRNWWSAVLAILLLYTGTVMPYTLCFLEFRLDGAIDLGTGWVVINYMVDALFWIDLFFCFFCSYTDVNGHEVTHFRKVAKNYLFGYFSLNFLACFPTELVELCLDGGGGGGDIGSLAKLSRMQRIGRLTRLFRLLRLVKIFAYIKDNPFWNWLQQQRGVRILNFTCGLLWIVHLVACGWYLTAACHEEVKDTWVYRRQVADGSSLMYSDPFDQWLASMYFVMTVFSTVGFGDISAVTNGEIFYAIFAMLLGAIVHGMIMSEVINVLTEMDDRAVETRTQKQLMKQFAEQTELDDSAVKALSAWMNPAASSKRRAYQYDRKAMKKMLTTGAMPYSLMDQLQRDVYGGDLLRNNFVLVCSNRSANGGIPPKFPVLLAISLSKYEFERGESVYEMNDLPYNIYLVLNGTFACVGRPGHNGGVDDGITKNQGSSSLRQEILLSHSKTKRSLGVDEEGHLKKPSTPEPYDHHSSWRSGAMRALSSTIKCDTPTAPQLSPRSAVYPYKLYGHGSYFGDFEVIVPLKKSEHFSRNCSMRCESEIGTVLILDRTEVVNLLQDFPHYGDAWFAAAKSSERARLSALRRLRHDSDKKALKYRHFAALQIQDFWRSIRRAGAGKVRRKATVGRTNWLSLQQQVKTEEGETDPFLHDPEDSGNNFNNVAMQKEVKTLRRDMKDMKDGLHELKELMLAGMKRRSQSPLDQSYSLNHSNSFDPDGPQSPRHGSRSVSVQPPESAPPDMQILRLSAGGSSESLGNLHSPSLR